MNIQIKFGNILNFNGESIVNTVNSHLSAGFGLDGQIRKKAGPVLEQQLRQHNRCDVGGVVTTTGGRLRYQFVIHAVGPIWKGGNFKEEELLKETYLNIFSKAEKLGIKSIAIPNISTGIFRFPKGKAAEIAIKTLSMFKFNSLKEITFYCFEKQNYEIYQNQITTLVSSD